MIVLDASIVVDILIQTKDSPNIENKLLSKKNAFYSPYLLDIEVLSVLRKFYLSKEMSHHRCLEAIDDLRSMPIERVSTDALLELAWNHRDQITAYDAIYVALTELLDATFWTRDQKLYSYAKNCIDVKLL
jgi:predicted nucleic acid-binding protein